MPYRSRRPLKRRRRKRWRTAGLPQQGQRSKWFRNPGPTNSLYRPLVPRTLQIATRRNMSQRLRFVVNQIYDYNPGTLTGTETNGMTFRANSICDVRADTYGTPGVFTAQDPSYAIGTTPLQAEGWDDWVERYQHFTVLGSKISVTFEPYGTGEDQGQPGMLALKVSGVNGTIDANTNAAAINRLPYLKKGHVMGACNQNRGTRLYAFYSAKKFEGVKDVIDNSALRGRFNQASPGTGVPGERSFFEVALCKLNPAVGPQMPKGILSVRIEYIVHLGEPTETNQVQAPAGMGVFADV